MTAMQGRPEHAFACERLARAQLQSTELNRGSAHTLWNQIYFIQTEEGTCPVLDQVPSHIQTEVSEVLTPHPGLLVHP